MCIGSIWSTLPRPLPCLQLGSVSVSMSLLWSLSSHSIRSSSLSKSSLSPISIRSMYRYACCVIIFFFSPIIFLLYLVQSPDCNELLNVHSKVVIAAISGWKGAVKEGNDVLCSQSHLVVHIRPRKP